MLFDDKLSAGKSANSPPTSTKSYPAWVHDLIAHEVDVAIDRYRRCVEPGSEKEQEMVKRRPK